MYPKLFLYLRSHKRTYIFIACLFSVSIITGVLFPDISADAQERLINGLLEEANKNNPVQFIISNNVAVTLAVILLGFTFFSVPVAAVMFNGYFFGAVLARALENMTLWQAAVRVLPHGIFEIPAVLLAFSLSFVISSAWLEKDKIARLKYHYLQSLKAFILIILPLLVVAGIIEGSLFAML